MKASEPEEKLVSKFFAEADYPRRKPPRHWQAVPIPASIKAPSILDHLRVVKPYVADEDEELEQSLDKFKLNRLERQIY
ncbi:hypothetical protein VKS41_000936 [Umbelopsis sp. WA50703]